MTEYITGWGLTSKQLKALVHLNALFITAIPNCASKLYSEGVFEGKVELFATQPQAQRIALTPLFINAIYCILNQDDDFWVLIPTDEDLIDTATAGFLWRLHQDGNFCVATQEQADDMQILDRTMVRKGITVEPISLYYGTQIIANEDDDDMEEDDV